MIAIGTGLFKPSISALVGGLYGQRDTRRDAGFSLFYMGINIGGFFAPLVTGFLAQSPAMKEWLTARGLDPLQSWHWGFAAAGIGMVLGLAIFVFFGGGIARDDDESAAPLSLSPTAADPREAISKLVMATFATLGLMALIVLSDRPGFEALRWAYVLVPAAVALWFGFSRDGESRQYGAMAFLLIGSILFWAIFEQAGVTIALFADQLTRSEFGGWTFPSAYFQSLNPLFVILLAPFFAALWMRLGDRQPSSPVKFGSRSCCLRFRSC